MTKAWHEMTALALGRAIGASEIDPVELCEHFLERCDRLDGDRRTYVRLTYERARQEAAAARTRARLGNRLSPLDGVPLSWKDLFDTAGVLTEGGTMLLEGRVPDRDAEVLRRASRAGAVCLGKTSMPDLAFSGLGINVWSGTPVNPHDRDVERLPGGSSAGAAVSVASGLAAAGIGSDTGGSVRIPAAWCGLTGLKTTHGQIPLEGVVPLSPSLDTIGPLTRDVADAAALYAILANRPAPDLGGASLEGARLLRAGTVLGEGVDDGVAAAVEAAVRRLAVAGARVEDGPVPEFSGVVELCERHGQMVNAEGYAIWGEEIEANPDRIHKPVADRFRLARDFSAIDATKARLGLGQLSKSYQARVAGYDAVIGPTVPITAPALAPLLADDAAYARAALAAVRHTRLGNMLGLCAVTLPCGTADGLPVGLMLMAPPHNEGRLLRLAKAAEAALRAA